DGVVRYVGEPIGLVLAETAAQAMDAVEAMRVEYDPLPVVVDPATALAGDVPLLFPNARTNLADEFLADWDLDVLSWSDVVVRARFVNQRLAPVPMETNAV